MHLKDRFGILKRTLRCNMQNKIDELNRQLVKKGGVLKTSELNEIGFLSRQINRLVDKGILSRIKHGFYESVENPPKEEAIITRLFPKATIFLESAAMYYQYTDRIPAAWQIAVDKDSNQNQYNIDYPIVEPYYLESKFIELGVETIDVEGTFVRIYDRDRTVCDFLRYENKLDNEVFTNVIKRYVSDKDKNIKKLFDYAKVLNIENKVQRYIGVWL